MYLIIAIILACFAIGWLFPPALATGLAMAAFLAVLLIPVIIILVIMNTVFEAAGLEEPPPIPGYCFDGDTEITVKNGKKLK